MSLNNVYINFCNVFNDQILNWIKWTFDPLDYVWIYETYGSGMEYDGAGRSGAKWNIGVTQLFN